MISSQIDKLRELAIRANGLYEYEMERGLDQAADLIWQLRDDLQRTNEAVQDAEHDESMAWDRVRKAEAENEKFIVKLNAEHIVRQNVEIENARLRELVKYAYECAIHSDHATCDDCERINGCCILADRMRELGIEEDE